MLRTRKFLKLSSPVSAVQVTEENVGWCCEWVKGRPASEMTQIPQKVPSDEFIWVDSKGEPYFGPEHTIMWLHSEEPQTVRLYGDAKIVHSKVAYMGTWYPVVAGDWIVEENGWFSVYDNDDFVKFYVEYESSDARDVTQHV